ncbi:hypothetical protein GR250_38545, partial [Rhizobium leguminosarum]|nr:hypothetical protein [Rhizobium leguminosarum]
MRAVRWARARADRARTGGTRMDQPVTEGAPAASDVPVSAPARAGETLS